MYNQFAPDYDRFVNWPARLAYEMPFLERLLGGPQSSPRVLDAACGTGRHVLELARRGYHAAGADLEPAMVEQARALAAAQGLEARFAAAGFGDLRATFGAQSFDAVLCLGNSLPHLLDPDALHTALRDFAAVLRSGGLLVVQNRNFDRVMVLRQRWMEPQSARDGEREWLFVRFYDFDPDGRITFHVIRMAREGQAAWVQSPMSTRLWPLRRADLVPALQADGFTAVEPFGGLDGSPFDAGTSDNLVIAARQAESGG